MAKGRWYATRGRMMLAIRFWREGVSTRAETVKRIMEATGCSYASANHAVNHVESCHVKECPYRRSR